ncbi:MAG: hypothetical protein EAZ08_10065 [Cytophagales bacterium]|nr:MAG: hypothetical protein EAZ08_10065 [Cytophagales bacterium]
MKKTSLFFAMLWLFCSIIAKGQDKKQQDITAIKNMCGCFEVAFDYAETFSPDTAYKFVKPYHAKGVEWIVLEEDADSKLVLQHLLVINPTTVIKHWREDWLYENTALLVYQGNRQWLFNKMNPEKVKGQWTQKVYEVEDSPRYEQTATWIHYDGRHYWESKTPAPLPRREYSKRTDYNVMIRLNHHEITDYGHLHEQDNQKIIRTEAQEQLLVEEKGINAYRKVEDSKCIAAKEWWEKNRLFWADVRATWAEVFEQQKDIKMLDKVEDKNFFMAMTELETAANRGRKYDSKKIKPLIGEVIRKYIK